jgi:hypothetical protein
VTQCLRLADDVTQCLCLADDVMQCLCLANDACVGKRPVTSSSTQPERRGDDTHVCKRA